MFDKLVFVEHHGPLSSPVGFLNDFLGFVSNDDVIPAVSMIHSIISLLINFEKFFDYFFRIMILFLFPILTFKTTFRF